MPGSFATIQVHTLIQKIGPLYGGKAALYRMALSERHPPLGRIGGSLIQFVSNVRQRKIAAPFGAADPNSGCATIGARGGDWFDASGDLRQTRGQNSLGAPVVFDDSPDPGRCVGNLARPRQCFELVATSRKGSGADIRRT